MMSYSSHQSRRIASNMLLRGGELLRNPIVEVAHDGEILSIETLDEGAAIDRHPSTEFYSGIMMAGFVNVHCHLELSYLRDMIPSGAGFAAFASRIAEVRGGFSTQQREQAMARADAEMLREGIVAVGDIVNGASSFETKSRSQIEYRSFAELFGLRQKDISPIEELLTLPHTSATPHSLYSLNNDPFRLVVERAQNNTQGGRLSIHFMESAAEAELFRGEGRLYEWYSKEGFECDFLNYDSPAERLIHSVPRDQSVILVHNTCLSEHDIDIIMGHFTAPVYWVLCPRSNRYISDLTPPVQLMRQRSLNICIGTDSLASNWSLSIIEELKALQGVPLVERLDWATRIGAAALGLDSMGDIEVGRHPKINILSGIDYSTMELTDRSSVRRIF